MFRLTSPVLPVLAILLAAPSAPAQTILGRNLIVNGDAEAGPASNGGSTQVASIPGWTRTGKPDVLPYDLMGFILLSSSVPPDHGGQYFYNANLAASTLSQDIDLSSGAGVISAGNIVFAASAYLGSVNGSTSATVLVAFKNAAGQTISSVAVGPTGPTGFAGLLLQRQIGAVPVSTTRITVTLTLQYAPAAGFRDGGAADSLSLVLNAPSPPESVLGINLITNGDAEAGPGVPAPNIAPNIPGWSRTGQFSVSPYNGFATFLTTASPGPTDRGVNAFYGGPNAAASTGNQELDVSPAAALIDSGSVQYQVSAWLGGSGSEEDNAVLKYLFFDWSGKQLAPTSQMGPVTASDRNNMTGLLSQSQTGSLPPGTRRIEIDLILTRVSRFNSGINHAFADNVSFVIRAATGRPSVKAVFSATAFGGFASTGLGTWIEIYGSALSANTRSWGSTDFNNGRAPTFLDDVSVTIGGKPAFVDYISPSQINALVPSDAPTGPVQLVVTNTNGVSDGYNMIVNQTSPGVLAPPSFQINGTLYVAALFGDGQTFALPQGAIAGLPSRPAKPGEAIVIYGIGFGPVTGGLIAGTLVNQQNSLVTPVQFLFGSTPATLAYYGLAPGFTGLYQFNVVVPSVPDNDAVPLTVNLGGVAGTQQLNIAVRQ